MIARLDGFVLAKDKDSVVLQVGGVGFRVHVPHNLLGDLAGLGQPQTLFTHLHVRENELTLYGFGSEEEMAFFRLLQTVSGIGPKAALAILSSLTPAELRVTIAQGDEARLSRVPGIGLKTAKKLVFDLKDKLAAELPPGQLAPALTDADLDLIAALTGLGYSVAEAQAAIRSVPGQGLPFEERVRLALAYFAS